MNYREVLMNKSGLEIWIGIGRVKNFLIKMEEKIMESQCEVLHIKKGKRVLVTGANGFLATNVIERLLDEGYLVRGLLRNRESIGIYLSGKLVSNCRLELVEGNFTDSPSLIDTIKGCDYVIHVAAVTNPSLLNYGDYHRVNASAVANLIQASIESRVKRFVLVSTANVFGYGTKEEPGSENSPISKPFTKSFYARSKAAGQAIALSFCNKIEVVVVNPTFMLGKYGHVYGFNCKASGSNGKISGPTNKLSGPTDKISVHTSLTAYGSNQIISRALGKRIIFAPPGGKNFIPVTEAARGVLLALEKGQNGESYLLAGENLTYREFYERMNKVTGSKLSVVTIPAVVMKIAGAAGSMLRLFGHKCPLSITNANILCINNFYSNKKAVKELGLTDLPIDSGLTI